MLEIDGNYKLNENLKFGERFNEKGFDFTINLRDTSGF